MSELKRSLENEALGRAVCERIGVDPAIVGTEDFRVQVTGGEELGTVRLTVYLPADELFAMMQAAGVVIS